MSKWTCLIVGKASRASGIASGCHFGDKTESGCHVGDKIKQIFRAQTQANTRENASASEFEPSLSIVVHVTVMGRASTQVNLDKDAVHCGSTKEI